VVTKLKAPPLLIVHTPIVAELKLGVNPELALAVKVGLVPMFCAPGLVNVMVCDPIGVTLLEALELLPVPALLVAVTLKV
jgi:hypothetical protein